MSFSAINVLVADCTKSPHFLKTTVKQVQALTQLDDSELNIQGSQRMHSVKVNPPKMLREINMCIRTPQHVLHSSVPNSFYVVFLKI